MFRELYPDEVVGLVFVDARHESAEPVGRTPEQNRQDREAYEASLNLYRVLRQFGVARIFGVPLSRALVPGQENLSDDLVYENAMFGVRESTLQTMIAESPATTYSDNLLKAARPLGNLPVIVLTARSSLKLQPGWDVVQQNLVALSTNSRWTIVENTGHNIQSEQPGVFVNAVRDMLEAVRTGKPLTQ
jgi:pimeloyl-ACP methyl ester carboxylesterase